MSEPTRPVFNPTVQRNGDLRVEGYFTPESFNVRSMATIGSDYVIPVVFVPGIMGTNLKATTDPSHEQNQELKPGEPAWRMPNNPIDGLLEAAKWKERSPKQRQKILDPATLEVDDTGDITVPSYVLDPKEMRKQGWGEVHAGSYTALLFTLQNHLDFTFRQDNLRRRVLWEHWQDVMKCDPKRWGVDHIAPLTEAELEKYAHYQYPVYAVGYNWLESCAKSSLRLEEKIKEIIAYWSKRKHVCKQVILVTHSMGGVVARACAKRIPDKIAGIVHGVMPALGAPIAYRRIACGTESFSPTNHSIAFEKFADIAGQTTEATTPVMAVAVGVLEMLPTHRYPGPWLFASTTSKSMKGDGKLDYSEHLALPVGSPYDLYRDMKSWYRLLDPSIADPAGKYKKVPGGIEKAISDAVDAAEQFHTQVLDNYYHPNSYAYYGADPEHRSFSRVRWVAPFPDGLGTPLTKKNVGNAKTVSHTTSGGRHVAVEGKHPFFLAISADLQLN